ncbi:hypothetical protein [Leptothoe spongobia]|nr:hypothetical protein [Leptothoe spongobia]
MDINLLNDRYFYSEHAPSPNNLDKRIEYEVRLAAQENIPMLLPEYPGSQLISRKIEQHASSYGVTLVKPLEPSPSRPFIVPNWLLDLAYLKKLLKKEDISFPIGNLDWFFIVLPAALVSLMAEGNASNESLNFSSNKSPADNPDTLNQPNLNSENFDSASPPWLDARNSVSLRDRDNPIILSSYTPKSNTLGQNTNNDQSSVEQAGQGIELGSPSTATGLSSLSEPENGLRNLETTVASVSQISDLSQSQATDLDEANLDEQNPQGISSNAETINITSESEENASAETELLESTDLIEPADSDESLQSVEGSDTKNQTSVESEIQDSTAPTSNTSSQESIPDDSQSQILAVDNTHSSNENNEASSQTSSENETVTDIEESPISSIDNVDNETVTDIEESPISPIDNADTAPSPSQDLSSIAITTVKETGIISLEFLLDGGAYEGELGIVSLEGLASYDVDSSEFARELARRAASNSSLGYIAVSDALEEARFSDTLALDTFIESGDYDFGQSKQFVFDPGTPVTFVLIPDTTFEEAISIPEWNSRSRPLIPSTQVKDLTGDGLIWGFEDQPLESSVNDSDFDDIIIHIDNGTTDELTGDPANITLDPAFEGNSDSSSQTALVEDENTSLILESDDVIGAATNDLMMDNLGADTSPANFSPKSESEQTATDAGLPKNDPPVKLDGIDF